MIRYKENSQGRKQNSVAEACSDVNNFLDWAKIEKNVFKALDQHDRTEKADVSAAPIWKTGIEFLHINVRNIAMFLLLGFIFNVAAVTFSTRSSFILPILNQPQNDPQARFIAGDLNGVSLYWYNENLAFDTLFWHTCAQKSGLVGESQGKSPENFTIHKENDKASFYKVTHGNALSLAILHDLSFPLFLLTRWSGSLQRVEKDTRGKLEDKTYVSHYQWEIVDSVSVKKPSGTYSYYTVRIYFNNGGFSEFRGNESLILSRSQILGTRGFSLRDKYSGHVPDENLYRLITAVYFVSDKKKSQVIANMEEVMDGIGLDLSYKPPLINVVNQIK